MKVFSFIVIYFCLIAARAQADTARSKNKFTGLPVVFFLPETSWGFGGLANYTFKSQSASSDTRDSQVQFGFAYTLNKQWLFYLPFNVFTEKYNFYGEVGYFLYNFNFYGTGNGSNDFEEKYQVNFPRIQLNALKEFDFYNNFNGKTYLGLRYWYEKYDVKTYEPGGRFDQGKVFGTTNNTTSSIGMVYRKDSRDNIFFPSKGIFETLSVQYDHPLWGSSYKFLQASWDISWYKKLRWDDILVVNGFTMWNFGETPFNKLAMIGGTKKMRGYYEGRFRDNNLLMLQAAYRKHLFWRIGAEIFTGFGSVFPEGDISEIKNIKGTAGAGLRFELDTERKINLRIDYGWAPESSGIYVTIGEAF